MTPGAADQFRTIAEIGGDVACIVDCRTGEPTYISASVEQLVGYSPDELRGQMAGGALVPVMAGLPARLARFVAGDLSRLKLVREFDFPHRDGHLVPVEIISSVLVDQAGQPSVLVGLIRDLSARREHEAGRRRFASMLNHEFRTPLSTIDGAIQRLEVTGADADQPTRERYRRISAAVERLIGMLDQYLSPDRVEASGTVRRTDSINPRRLLEEGALLARAAGRHATLALGDLPDTLRGEPQGLRLALKVLVDNALQYSPAGTPIALSGQRTEGGIELRVRDHGAGVPEGETELIFAKSRRGSNAGARPGSGLGLYMARSVVEVHGGTVGVEPAGAEGAVFTIFLPIRESSGKLVASSGDTSDNSGNKIRLALGPDNAQP
ncbi:PAS domain-containing sensor histidine kinase [Massilia sp. R2A-15]|uniref:PAS domain-containing sensor histidine kinase n=1 Tax=Massilia sp. R2A-15 TaxID=3064278 RepID=UPI00273404CB|nr:PAS domain-containing sensor histidine kinase [Massilia sp. R2A-15]WLI89166.1 PAS domain-containing sensor histidine kinase [Massilia sp. R2A-15]